MFYKHLNCKFLVVLVAGEITCQKDSKGGESGHSQRLPACDKTGGYNPLQCDQSSGSCWCIDRLGREIPRTRNNDTRRNCDAAGMQVFDVATYSSYFSFVLMHGQQLQQQQQQQLRYVLCKLRKIHVPLTLQYCNGCGTCTIHYIGALYKKKRVKIPFWKSYTIDQYISMFMVVVMSK